MARRVSPDELVKVLDEAFEALGSAAVMASDGDGTLWRGDVGEDLFELAVAEGLLRPAALAALRGEAAAHDIAVADDADASGVARELLSSHREGRYPNGPAFAMMAWAFAGFTESELDALCERSLDERGFAERVRPELAPVHAWARDRGVPLWLVSASPTAVAAAAGRRMGIPREQVVAMDPRVVDGVVLPELGDEPTYRDGKLRRLRACTGETLLAGFGDSYWDLALIEEARVGVAVAPNPTLRERMAELDRGFVLEAI